MGITVGFKSPQDFLTCGQVGKFMPGTAPLKGVRVTWVASPPRTPPPALKVPYLQLQPNSCKSCWKGKKYQCHQSCAYSGQLFFFFWAFFWGGQCVLRGSPIMDKMCLFRTRFFLSFWGVGVGGMLVLGWPLPKTNNFQWLPHWKDED